MSLYIIALKSLLKVMMREQQGLNLEDSKSRCGCDECDEDTVLTNTINQLQNYTTTLQCISIHVLCVGCCKRLNCVCMYVWMVYLGDGANDVSMIQVADVGVGISGQEGMQVCLSTPPILFSFFSALLCSSYRSNCGVRFQH